MKGICFIEPLFLAVENGTKTQTRRMMVPQPDDRGTRTTNVLFEDFHGTTIKPRYNKGKLVYLKEPYADDLVLDGTFYKYRKEDIDALKKAGYEEYIKAPGFWKNKLYMPESQRRYVIRINDVRAERLNDITESDAIAEGVKENHDVFHPYYKPEIGNTYRRNFAVLWQKINGEKSWDENPFVFVYDFELMPV